MTLVDTADKFDYKYCATTNSGKIVYIQGQETHVDILYFIEFSSAWKRSTVVVREGDLVKIFVKGADNIVIGLLSK